MKKIILITLIIVALLIISGIYLNLNKKDYTGIQTQEKNKNVVENFEVSIKSFAFSPSEITIKIGETVKWKNLDSATHTIVSDSGNEIISNELDNGEEFSHTFNKPGIYNYHCSLHSSMKGKVIVE